MNTSEMNSLDQLQAMQASWPETTDYLEKVGQLNNDLMVLREAAAREKITVDWMDRLAIEPHDLLSRPDAIDIAKLLHQNNIRLAALMSLTEYQEAVQEQQTQFAAGDEVIEHPLEDMRYQLTPGSEEQLWKSPELGSQLIRWAGQTVSRVLAIETELTVTQATIVFRLFQFLNQEDPSPGLVEESLRSLLSSVFFEMAGTPQPSR